MPYISAEEFTSPILKKIANGDESVFSGVPGNDFNLTEMAAYREWSPLFLACNNGNIHIVNRLLEIPAVATNAAADNNYALRWAAEGGYFEIAHTLAKLQWPRGKIDMPYDLHQCLPAIHQGAIIYSGRKESENLVKCWIRGNPTNNTSDIHYPSHNESSQEHVLIDINTAPRLIMQYAGCIDVAREAGNESRADHVMNSLLYSSRLHKTFQTAYENGQRESRERLGYGDGAMVDNPGRPKPGM